MQAWITVIVDIILHVSQEWGEGCNHRRVQLCNGNNFYESKKQVPKLVQLNCLTYFITVLEVLLLYYYFLNQLISIIQIFDMNNFRNFSRKYDRGVLERTVLSKLRSNFPNLEHSIGSHRFPTLPKIILYSSLANSEESLKNIFPFYNIITPTPTAETDEIITRRIAEQLIQIDQANENEGNRFGYIIKGFPFNTLQAQLLDRYINGVNLALHLRTASQSADYITSMNPLLGYYRERGTLLELSHSNYPTLEETENTFEQIKIHIKRSL